MSNETQQNVFKTLFILIGMLQAAWMYILSNMGENIESLQSQAKDMTLYSTETYARKDDMSEMEKRIIDAINKVGERIDR